MIGTDKKQEDFKSRKHYLVALAIDYIKNHTGYMGIDDDVFFDEAECDGYALAEDLAIEFNIEEE
jgi:hypothetical protein